MARRVLTKCAKHNEWKSVSNDPFSDGTKDHEDTSETEVDALNHSRQQDNVNYGVIRCGLYLC